MKKKLIEMIMIIVLTLLLISVSGLLVMLCWNYVIPHIFNLPKISWTQGFTLMFLKELLSRDTSVSFKE